MKKVSVIVPVYNVEKYIKNTLDCLFNQTYKNIEYIFVDDCGSDSSIDIVREKIIESDNINKAIIVRHDKNYGLAVARNTGLEKSSGDYIFFVDADDAINDECIEKHVKAIECEKSDFSVANMKLQNRKSVHVHKITNKISLLRPLQTFLTRQWNVSACNKMYSRDFIMSNKLKFVPKLIFEDILWSYMVAKLAKKISVIEDETYIYNYRPESLTSSKGNSLKINSMINIINFLVNDLSSLGQGDRILLENFISRLRLNAMLLLLNYSGDKNEIKQFYNELNSNICNRRVTIMDVIVSRVPYELFCVIMKPVYIAYKIISRM